MSRLVLDASALIKLFLNEDGSRAVEAAINKADGLLAPELLWAEAGNILWKYVRRKALVAEDAKEILRDMLQLPVLLSATRELIEPALKLAIETDRTVYDCIYLALAVQTNEVLLTADARLANALVATPYAAYVQHTA